ncbi:MAG: heme lyase CcmF/NrfE family subunit [Ectothiorhodospiraceae bacterium]|nr:heme lyase CcmF/NrfE family subunit [Ectothiorhodospiraceae bacterium]
MIAELGHFALILALCLSAVQAVIPLVGAARGIVAWQAVAGPAAQAQFVFVAVSFAALTWSFVESDFSVLYVASNSNTDLPLFYRVSAVWGAHEGSMLLWMLILSGWGFAVSIASRSLPFSFRARVLGILGLVSIGFGLFILITSNPFERLLPPAIEGRDLNPLLQDPGMIIHPPLLYMGYVGLSVPFAFACAALLDGRLNAAWTRWTRPWTTVAWVFLTLGIAIGSWWAYNELGWGGWWFWDPVENASFMPWLVATALLHSLAVTEQRGAFRAWTVLLAIFGFSLSLLGTFLVRSGVLVSVHAFATDPARGVFILSFLAIVIGGALGLFAWRAPRVSGGGQFDYLSRETLLLVNNVLLVVASGAILLGTLYPLLHDALGLGKLSVGPPYFNSIFVPLMIPVALLVGIGPLVRWKADTVGAVAARVRWAVVATIVATVALALLGAAETMGLLAAIALALWVTFSTLSGVWQRLRNRRDRIGALGTLPRAFVGMTLAHLGIAVFVVGVAGVTVLSSEKDVRLGTGESTELGGYRFTLVGVAEVPGPNYRAIRGEIQVHQGEERVALLHPEKRFYPIQAQPMTEAAIYQRLTGDLYVALGDQVGDGAWAVRVHEKAFVRWIWAGCLLMSLGGALAAADRRYRPERARVPAAAAGSRA